jgi:hypothetical protein
MAKKKSLLELVGERIKIERGDVTYEGVLVDMDSKRQWRVFDVDDFAKTKTDFKFGEHDGWTVTKVDDPRDKM